MSDPVEFALGKGVAALGGLSLLVSTIDGPAIFSWIERVGFAATAAGVLYLTGYRLARWVGVKVVEPLVARAVATFDKVQAGIDLVTTTLTTQAATLERVADSETRTLQCVQAFTEEARRDREERKTTLHAIADGLADNRTRLERIENAMGLDGPAPAEGDPR